MMFLILQPKVPAQANEVNGDEQRDPIRKVLPHRVKVMTMLKTMEKVKRESKKLTLQCSLFAKQGSRVSSLIRIQIEETKRKVGFYSPAALRFIGPGDR
jgi:hypothetical protein